MKRALVAVIAGALVFTQGCGDVTRIPTPTVAAAGRIAKEVECVPDGTELQECPEEILGPPSVRPFGANFPMGQDVPYEVPGAPGDSPSGVWLGSDVTPNTCFSDRGASIVDADRDWLDDRCELELARGFAPTWQFNYLRESCPFGEPLWTAKYFPGPQVVRIAYLPAYYMDCGNYEGVGTGHNGDSEFVMVQVGWHDGLQRWLFQVMYLTNHHHSDLDQNLWAFPSETYFTGRQLGHPFVWVSADKHANYAYDCSGEEWRADWCSSDPEARGRFPVYANRNIGSMHTPLIGCIPSAGYYAGNGMTECFYTQSESFCGWRSRGGACVTQFGPHTASYYNRLRNITYDEYSPGNWGPGPGAYQPPPPPEPPEPPVGCEPPECEPETLRAAPASPRRNGPKGATTAKPGSPSAKPAPTRVVSVRQ